ncbi:hypothetical protein [Streptomyces sp. NPDC055243]|uniref:hypothetical protein n=1 Tax=Streptomyces sp. NPDC055243 TaxID=3365720 RepID=UPI0037D737FB
MGALVALETARVFQARGTRVAHLFASGNRNAASYPPPAARRPRERRRNDPLMDTRSRSCTAPFPQSPAPNTSMRTVDHSEPPYSLIRKSPNVKITSRKDSPHAGQ